MNSTKDIGFTHVKNYTKNGNCSNCGECCSEFLPVTEQEIRNICDYLQEHNLEPESHVTFDPLVIDMLCPFRNKTSNTCIIYPVRPEICKTFTCNQNINTIEQNKMRFANRNDIFEISMHVTFLKDPFIRHLIETDSLYAQAITHVNLVVEGETIRRLYFQQKETNSVFDIEVK